MIDIAYRFIDIKEFGRIDICDSRVKKFLKDKGYLETEISYTDEMMIFTPLARYVSMEKEQNRSYGKFLLFHNITVPNTFNAISDKNLLPYVTIGCDNVDEAGFCRGHKCSRIEFIKKFCNGKKPRQLLPEEVYEAAKRIYKNAIQSGRPIRSGL